MIGEKYVRKLLAWCPRESLERWISISAGKKHMKIELKIALSKTIFILLIAGIFGVFSGGLFPSSYGGKGILYVHSENMIIANGTSVSAQSLYEDTSRSWRFPPLEFATEQIDFTVYIKNATGGMLWIDFISNDKVLRSEYVFGTEKIVLSAFEEYRWGYSSVDVLLRAISEDVTISSIYIDVYHNHKDYNPISTTVYMTLFVGLLIAVPHYWAKVKRAEEKKPTASWYLAPIFLGVIGGILGWLTFKDDDPKRARILLIVGILLITHTPGIGGFLMDFLMPH